MIDSLWMRMAGDSTRGENAVGTTSAWRRLDRDRAALLEPARVELHWAAQLAAAAGATVLPKRDDFEHTTLAWSRAHEALVGRPLAGHASAALRPRDLALLVIAGEDVVAEQTLHGRTMAQGLRWLGGELSRRLDAPLPALEPPAHDLPDHPVGRGEPFGAEHGAAFVELADWFANAHHLLEVVVDRHPGATEVRCWPHHFDLATRIARGSDRSIGVGMSPGDGTERAPYFYVSPWPYPEDRALPDLPAGARWNTVGWVGALLPGTMLEPDPTAQRVQALAFVDDAIRACTALLE
jgi:hypothetical protein